MLEKETEGRVQRELAAERRALRDYIRGDPLLGRYFDVFLFEDLPAVDRRPDEVYLEQLNRASVYLGLFGLQYGSGDRGGVSPTEREFDRATEERKTRLVFVKSADDRERHPKMLVLIRKAERQLTRRRFNDTSDLTGRVYASLIGHLEQRGVLPRRPSRGADTPQPARRRAALSLRGPSLRNPAPALSSCRGGQVPPLPRHGASEAPPALTPDQLRRTHPSIPHNPLICEALFLAHYIEKAGTGTLDVIAGCRAANLPEPDFRQDGSEFVVTLWRDWLTAGALAGLGLSERERQAVMFARTHRRIRNAEYQRITGANKKTASRDLDELVRKSVFARVGTTGRGTYYVMTGTPRGRQGDKRDSGPAKLKGDTKGTKGTSGRAGLRTRQKSDKPARASTGGKGVKRGIEGTAPSRGDRGGRKGDRIQPTRGKRRAQVARRIARG